MCEQAFDDQCTGANPRYPLISEIKQMYLNAYYGEHKGERIGSIPKDAVAKDGHDFKQTYRDAENKRM